MIDRVKKVIAKVMQDDEIMATINEDSDIIYDLGFDSLQMVDFLLEVEKEFSISINLEELNFEQVRSVRNFINFIGDQQVAR